MDYTSRINNEINTDGSQITNLLSGFANTVFQVGADFTVVTDQLTTVVVTQLGITNLNPFRIVEAKKLLDGLTFYKIRYVVPAMNITAVNYTVDFNIPMTATNVFLVDQQGVCVSGVGPVDLSNPLNCVSTSNHQVGFWDIWFTSPTPMAEPIKQVITHGELKINLPYNKVSDHYICPICNRECLSIDILGYDLPFCSNDGWLIDEYLSRLSRRTNKSVDIDGPVKVKDTLELISYSNDRPIYNEQVSLFISDEYEQSEVRQNFERVSLIRDQLVDQLESKKPTLNKYGQFIGES